MSSRVHTKVNHIVAQTCSKLYFMFTAVCFKILPEKLNIENQWKLTSEINIL